MEAATWMRNKTVSRLGAAKGLMFLFCLLTLICQTSSTVDKQELAKLRQNNEILKRELEGLKAEHKFLSNLLEYVPKPDQSMERLWDSFDSLPDGFPEMTKRLKQLTQKVEETHMSLKELEAVKHQLTELQKVIAVTEKNLEESDRILNSIEKEHDEF
ncbi:hypothetical protein FQA47_002507 [Oryzias melastigma]|uniref:Uncharacterized protein n=1 Tax=Oryzias melastigma TaxID=30732 RepID=A0A834FA39_ORYME|nr:hypothetical protein FQA47_002507 [Oryzias melastigma]